ncbi:MAG: LppX_LprAFG lipoprotein [Ktedonobacterales bacterium]
MRTRQIRVMIPLSMLVSLAVLSLAGCGGSTPATNTLLKDAQEQFTATKSLHFVMTTEHLGAVPIGSYSIVGATGDVARPDQLKGTATVDDGFGTIQIQLIIVGNQEWYTNPLTGQLVPTDQFGSYLRIFDPNTGIGSLLTGLKNPSQPSDGSANGTSCWKISGNITTAQLSPIFGSAVVGTAKSTTFCIGKSNHQLLSVVLQGQLLTGDTSQTIRTIYLSNFDQPVSIQTPSA